MNAGQKLGLTTLSVLNPPAGPRVAELDWEKVFFSPSVRISPRGCEMQFLAVHCEMQSISCLCGPTYIILSFSERCNF